MNLPEENKKRAEEWVQYMSENDASIVIAIAQKGKADIVIRRRLNKDTNLLAIAENLEEISQAIINQHTDSN